MPASEPSIGGSKHGVNVVEEGDLVDQMLNRSGCAEKHYLVQECIAEYKDWRKCQEVLKDFRNCVTQYEQKKRDAGT